MSSFSSKTTKPFPLVAHSHCFQGEAALEPVKEVLKYSMRTPHLHPTLTHLIVFLYSISHLHLSCQFAFLSICSSSSDLQPGSLMYDVELVILYGLEPLFADFEISDKETGRERAHHFRERKEMENWNSTNMTLPGSWHVLPECQHK